MLVLIYDKMLGGVADFILKLLSKISSWQSFFARHNIIQFGAHRRLSSYHANSSLWDSSSYLMKISPQPGILHRRVTLHLGHNALPLFYQKVK